jgi:hypothetical protein
MSTKKDEINEALTKLMESASVINGVYDLSFRTDVAFDIETGPSRPDLDDSNLLDAATARVSAIGYYLGV